MGLLRRKFLFVVLYSFPRSRNLESKYRRNFAIKLFQHISTEISVENNKQKTTRNIFTELQT